MKNIPQDMISGTVHQTKNYGSFEIIKFLRSREVKIKFILTKYESHAEAGDIRRGNVKDPFFPSIHGLGFVGIGDHKPTIKGTITKSYNAWINMFSRCYDSKIQYKYPTYKGCTVCSEWCNYQVFALWFELNYFDGSELDKDIKVNGNKIYSPSTCLMVTHQINSEKAQAKNYRFYNPNGEIVTMYNLKDFCKENNLHRSAMCLVHQGKRNHHKRWTKA